jgi:hypothetical protein
VGAAAGDTSPLPELDGATAPLDPIAPGEAGAADGTAKPRRRRRWWLRILIAVVALGVLAGAAEIVLRIITPGIVAEQVRLNLNLSDDHPVDVELGGSALLHALVGRVGPIEVEVPNAPLPEGIVATLGAEARSMPFDPTTGEIEGGRVAILIPAESVGTVVSLATQGMADTGEVRNGEITVGRTLPLFGATVTLAVTLELSVQDGDLWVEPTEINAAGFDLSVEQIRTVTGDSLDGMLQAHELCVRDRLPVGVTLTDLRLSSTGSVTIAADLSTGVLSDPRQQALGSCDG